MKTIVLASRKGGSGKSTLAAHLGVGLHQAGRGPVVLLDLDPQATLAGWWDRREQEYPAFADSTPEGLPARLAALASDGYAWAVVDTPPSVSDINRRAIAAADLVVIPARPSPHDLEALGATIDMCAAAGVPYVFVLNAAKGANGIALQTASALSEHGHVAPVAVVDRVAYAASMIDGRSISEAEPAGKGAAEMVAFRDFVISRFPEFRKVTRKEKARA